MSKERAEKLALFYPALTGSKTPTSKFGCKAKKLGGRSTARKSPIGSTNNQWRMDKTSND
ncbi:hypothetical protein EXW38_22840 [Bacillus mycoides]|nr:hypothetical protein EXW38_22840 [Bacillus mycoides]